MHPLKNERANRIRTFNRPIMDMILTTKNAGFNDFNPIKNLMRIFERRFGDS